MASGALPPCNFHTTPNSLIFSLDFSYILRYNDPTMKYHKQAYGLPTFSRFNLRLRYSRHAMERMKEKGIWGIPSCLDSVDCDIFEIEDTDIRKFALRTKYNATHDLCMAVDETGFVRTVWLNSVTDKHATLNKNLYNRP